MVEIIDKETVITAQYIDKIGIVQMTNIAESDVELGKMIREYISQCN